MLNRLALLLNSAYNNYPGRGSLDEQDLGSSMPPYSGGPGQQQEYWGASGAGRLGTGFGPMRGDNMGGMGGAPRGMGTSMMPGYSYKGGPDTPQYHLEIPYGGTPGIYAIRNDEIFGPKRDRLMNPPRHTGGRRRRRR